MFGIASFVLLLTPAALRGLDDVTQMTAIVGQRVELPCRLDATLNVNKMSWLKNGEIWFQFRFKDNYDIVLRKSHAILVIPSVEKNDAGLYQCDPLESYINLTVLSISQSTATESSNYNHISDLLQTILNGIFVNKVLIIITLLIGAGIIVVFYVPRCWNGKSGRFQTKAEQQDREGLLTDDFRKLQENIAAACEGIIAKMVELNGNMACTDEVLNNKLVEELKCMNELCIKQSERLEALLGDVDSKIGKLRDEVFQNHNTVVLELKKQSNTIIRQSKDVRGIQEILQQSGPSDKHSISVTDAELDG